MTSISLSELDYKTSTDQVLELLIKVQLLVVLEEILVELVGQEEETNLTKTCPLTLSRIAGKELANIISLYYLIMQKPILSAPELYGIYDCTYSGFFFDLMLAKQTLCLREYIQVILREYLCWY